MRARPFDEKTVMDVRGSEAVPALPAVVLAAGMSRRFVGGNKLLQPLDGVQLVRRVVEAYLGAPLSGVFVVVGFEAESIAAALAGLPIVTVFNPDYSVSQSRSLIRGVQALPPGTPAALIGVADQPFLTAAVVEAILTRYEQTHARLVAPRYAGQRGNPVLFRADLFPELMEVDGDVGGRPVLHRHAAEVEWLDFDDASIGVDIDTWEEYRAREQST